MNNNWPYVTGGISESFWEQRGSVPMTKEEVRVIVISKLRLKPSSILVDVGAGTGSVSIEAAMKISSGKVFSIEIRDDALSLIEKNIRRFEINNIEILKGKASSQIKKIDFFDRVFIGGSGKELNKIINYAFEALPIDGRIVGTAVTIETLSEFYNSLKILGFKGIEVTSVSISKGEKINDYTLMKAQNSIYILSAQKGDN